MARRKKPRPLTKKQLDRAKWLAERIVWTMDANAIRRPTAEKLPKGIAEKIAAAVGGVCVMP